MQKFRLRLCSDTDYEDLVLDIVFENNTIATLNQEKGVSNIEIELYPPPEGQLSWKFSLNEFNDILELAKKKLTNS